MGSLVRTPRDIYVDSRRSTVLHRQRSTCETVRRARRTRTEDRTMPLR